MKWFIDKLNTLMRKPREEGDERYFNDEQHYDKWNKYIDQRRHLLSSQFNFKTKPNVDWDFSDNSRLVSENSKTIGKYLLEDCESLALDISLVPIQNSSNKVNPYKDMNVFNGDNVVCYLDNGAVLL